MEGAFNAGSILKTMLSMSNHIIDHLAPQRISPEHQNHLPVLPVQTVISTFQGTGAGAPMGLLTEDPNVAC